MPFHPGPVVPDASGARSSADRPGPPGRSGLGRRRRPVGEDLPARDRPSRRDAVHRPALRGGPAPGDGRDAGTGPRGASRTAPAGIDGVSGRRPMRVVFLGNARWSVPPLEAVAGSGHEVSLVVTRTPRLGGRGNRPIPTPVAEAAR